MTYQIPNLDILSQTTMGGDDLLFNNGNFVNTPSIRPDFSNNGYQPNFNFNPTTGQASPIQQSGGFNWLGKDGVLIPGLNALGNLATAYTGLQQLNLNKDAFNFNKALTRTNLANQAKVTNAAIEDRARSAAIQEGRSSIPGLDRLVASETQDRKIKGSF